MSASGVRAWIAGMALAVSFAPVDIGYGLIVFQLLGHGYDGLGVASGWISVLLATVLVAVIMRSGHLYVSVRPAQTLSIAALLVTVLARFPQADATSTAVLALATVMVCASLSGLLQLGMGLLRVGRLVGFVPRPVLSGVSTAAAIGLAIKAGKTLFALFLATASPSGESLSTALTLQQSVVWFVFVAAALALMTWAARHLVTLNWSLVGLVFGVIVYAGLEAVWPAQAGGVSLGPTLPPLNVPDQLPVFVAAWQFLARDNGLQMLIDMSLTTALVVAIVNSLEALVYNARFERSTEVAHDPVKVLVALGFGNTIAGVLGGLPVSLSSTKMMLAWTSGVRHATGLVAHSGMLLVLIGATALYVHHIPKIAVALVMLYLAWMMLDAWSRRQLATWLKPGAFVRLLKEPHSTPAIFLLVIAAALLSNLVWGVTVGLLCAVFVFVQRQSQNIIRRSGSLADRRSAAMRNEAQSVCLQQNAHRLLYVELQGALFFGTSEQLLQGVRERLQPGHRFLLLDARRVLELDDAGCETIERLQSDMHRRGGELILSSLSEFIQWRSPQEARELCAAMKRPVVRSLDEALEQAEDGLIQCYGDDAARAEVCDLSAVAGGGSFLSVLSADARQSLLARLQRCEFAPDTVIFRKGDAGDALYLVLCGRVDIWLNAGDTDAVRLASFRQGVTFGEMGLLRDSARTADAVAVNEVLALRLSRDDLDYLKASAPADLASVLLAISQELSARLARTNRALRAALRT